MAGIFRSIVLSADRVITSNATLASSTLLFAIAANQRMHGTIYLPFSVGATGGIRLQLAVPTGGVAFNAQFLVQAVTTGAVSSVSQVASAAYTNALAVAADYTIVVHFSVLNGTTAGNVDLQIAQNTVDALSLTLQSGAYMDSVIV